VVIVMIWFLPQKFDRSKPNEVIFMYSQTGSALHVCTDNWD